MKMLNDRASKQRHRFSPLYGKQIVPKPIRRYLSYFAVVLAAFVLLVAFIQNTIPSLSSNARHGCCCLTLLDKPALTG